VLNLQTVVNVTILTPDVVRMNAQRERIIQNSISSPLGKTCNAFGSPNADGFTSVELWGGDEQQRLAFKQALAAELFR
jgi:hypothetical protein